MLNDFPTSETESADCAGENDFLIERSLFQPQEYRDENQERAGKLAESDEDERLEMIHSLCLSGVGKPPDDGSDDECAACDE